MRRRKILKFGGIILLAVCSLIPVIAPVTADPFETYNIQVSDFKVDDGIRFIIEGYQIQFAVAVNSSSRYEYVSAQNNNRTTVNIEAKEPGSYAIALTYVVTGPTNLTIIHRSRQTEGDMRIGAQDIELASIQRTGMDVELEYMAMVTFEATGKANDPTEPDPSVIVEKTVSLISLLPVHHFVFAIFFLVPFPMGLVAYKMTVPDKKARDLPDENVKYRLYCTYLRILFFLNASTPIILLVQGSFTEEFFVGFVVFQAIIFSVSILMRRKARNIDLDFEERMLLKGHHPPDDKDRETDKAEEGGR